MVPSARTRSSSLARHMRHGLPSSIPFELTGRYGGFTFTATGKRRMVLRAAGAGGSEYLLKVPKELRRRVVANFRPDEEVLVAGIEEKDALTGVTHRWVISSIRSARVVSLGGAPATPSSRCGDEVGGPILVCAKKNCWRAGGRELWHALEHALEARGLEAAIPLKAVHCLDRCKHAPNVEWQGCAFRRCTPADTETIVARVAAATLRSPSSPSPIPTGEAAGAR